MDLNFFRTAHTDTPFMSKKLHNGTLVYKRTYLFTISYSYLFFSKGLKMKKIIVQSALLAMTVLNLPSFSQTIPTNGATPFRINRPVNNWQGDAVLEFGDQYQTLRSVYGGGFRISTFNGTDALNLQEGTGNVGVGTTNPGSKLAVNGNAAIGYSTSTAAPTNGLAVSGQVGIGTNSPDSRYKLHMPSGVAQIGVNWLPSGTSPWYMLGLNNSNISGNQDCILNLNSKQGQTGVEFLSDGVQNWYIYTQNVGEPNHPLYTYSNNKPIKCLYQNGTEYLFGQMVITNDNTWTNPGSYKLAVDGKIGAREVVVTTAAWSDFVFKKDYKLKPLSEVEKDIKENGHLEGIPSEKEVLENGVPIGEMQAKLLQKVEELTLYMIELKKENNELKNKIELFNNN